MAVRLTDFSFRGESIIRSVFIETGTFQGDTLENARRAGFPTLHSIEIHAPNYLAAQSRFARRANVHLHLGSSPSVLPRIIDPTQSTTFWLDAHFQGSDASELDPSYGECPLLAELATIFSFRWAVHPIVLIDDAYMFDHRIHAGFVREQWPTRDDIRQAVPYDFDIREVDDVLYCIQASFRMSHGRRPVDGEND